MYNNNNDDKKQMYIIRQSQLERSLEYYTMLGKKPSMLEWVKTAELLKDYVLNGVSEDVKKRINGLDKYNQNELLDDIIQLQN
jgi:hypothetical protein